MNFTVWLDVAIGLALIYLGLSLFVTIINEYIAQFANWRSKHLCASLEQLLSDPNNPNLGKILANNPGLKPFFDNDPGTQSSYIDPNTLARLLVGGLATMGENGGSFKDISDVVDKLSDSPLKAQLQALVRTTENNTEKLVNSVSDWVDRSLTMLGESYKKRLQVSSFCIGLAAAIFLNIDTVALVEHLYKNKEARDATVALAVQITENTDAEQFEKCQKLNTKERESAPDCAALNGLINAIQLRNDDLGKLPIGRGENAIADAEFWCSISPASILGWLLTALSVSLGAPFWFELLNKLINVRHGMRKPEVIENSRER